MGLLAALVALAWPSPARADGAGATQSLAPRDVGVVIQPGATRLPAAPADFQRIDGGWLVLEFPASVRERAHALMADAQEFRARLAADLGQPVLAHALVRIARTPEQMAELAPEGSPPFVYATGMAYPSMHLILISMLAPDTWEAPDLGEVLRHELTHMALDEAVAGHHIPRWFDEGLAIHESGELWTKRFRVLWDATVSRRLLPLAELDRAFPADGSEVSIAYAESADVVRFLMRDDDRARFGSLVQRARSGVPFDRAVEDAYDTDLRKLEFQWREDASHRFGMVPLLTGGGALWTLIAGLALTAWARRRKTAKRKLAEWAKEEAEADAAMVAARERVVAAQAVGEAEDELPAHVRPGVPLVEHEGRWYTLH
ncbi:MAG: peptidase MA family metallohydrolase [Polyangiaceae bacterium]